ncbi:ABC transporter ATP-binding protein [Bradyrhizobium diazoefficiens]|uniref:ABC transporter ATP-binding protein n=1 Tax=Bradyrhizobium diazoefficiens TaxID=1355477 RepID=UPI001B8B047F|nr:ABC transporter ATP-binding protein [Bradyrhizobium diazoefficiens]MBR0863514.1 ABC transporter ATP-binding protein [Bradyrhizobium diazoefficiens]MBR0888199.1 ABC transporter ATP-binding protein [Bradyrhizobium diazoefficiens]MBR0919840.1 ABC transporter ATP-binding protein [Bradyrhizobium diazoefficiens]
MSDFVLRAQNVSAGYGDFQALFSVDFHVSSGEVVALIGANGAGKSTFLKTLARTLPLREGTVEFDGASTVGIAPHQLVGAGLVMVPEGRRLFVGMSVEDNLRVALDRARAISAGARPWTLERLYSLFPILKEKRHQSVERLSGGQQQMVAVGRALMAQPKLLLCDEISLGLAPKVIKEIYDLLPEIRDAGTAVVLVEQDVSLAQKTADRLYCMLEGRIKLTGRSSEISRDEIAAAYFGALHDVG